MSTKYKITFIKKASFVVLTLILVMNLSSCSITKSKNPEVTQTKLTPFEEAMFKKKGWCKEFLGFPFGTVLELKVEIIDGSKYSTREGYLMKILEINNKKSKELIILGFDDGHSNEFPSDDLDLYKKLYGKEAEIIEYDVLLKMKKEYVGKIYTITAFETGRFVGIPREFNKLTEGFHFETYLRILPHVNLKDHRSN